VSCETELYRDSEPLLTFENNLIDKQLTVGYEINNVNYILYYRNGLNRTVTVSVPETNKIYADPFQLTLENDEGEIVIPLKGKPDLEGTMTLQAEVTYGIFNIFPKRDIGIRPQNMTPVEYADDPVLEGLLYEDVISKNCFIKLAYNNGWTRKITAKISCPQDAGLNSEYTTELNITAQPDILSIPVSGRPQKSGLVDLQLMLEDEDGQELAFAFTDIFVGQVIPFVEETVSHRIIITDRNDLMAGATPEYREFTYKTIFVDLNGDGYVSDNSEIWLDKNVGATSDNVNLPESYGFYYQAARNAPGWVDNSQTGSTYPGELKLNNANWFNGTGQDVVINNQITVMSGKIGPYNPCPYGFRPPSQAELNALNTFLQNNPSNFNGEILKMPFAGGYLANTNTTLQNAGTYGYYWGRPVDNNQVVGLYLTTNVNIANRAKGMALCVRCVKAKESELATY